MTHPEPLYAAVRRQATYALTAFVCAACGLEVFMPGSVLPVIDIVPIGILAGSLLLYDATRRAHAHQIPWAPPVIKLCIAMGLFCIMFILLSWEGRAGMGAAVVCALGLGSLAFWPEK